MGEQALCPRFECGGVHIAVADTEDRESLCGDQGVAVSIGCELLRGLMVIAVQFDHELVFKTGEVHDERSDRVLATELESEEFAVTENAPGVALGGGCLLALAAGLVASVDASPHAAQHGIAGASRGNQNRAAMDGKSAGNGACRASPLSRKGEIA